MARVGVVERVRFTSDDDDEEAASLASVGVRASSGAHLRELTAAISACVLMEHRVPAVYGVEWIVPAGRAPRHCGVVCGGLAWSQHAGRIVWSESRGSDCVLRSVDGSAAAGAGAGAGEPSVAHVRGGGGARVDALVPHAGGSVLLGGATGLSLGAFSLGADVFPVAVGGGGVSIVDAVSDASGALLALLAPGRLARISATAPDAPVVLDDDCGGCVAVAASRDGGAVYVSDAGRRRVVAYGYSGADGVLHGKRTALAVSTTLHGDDAVPCGLAVDALGCVWVALRGAWRVVRFAPADGAIMGVVHLPVRCPSRLCFGGPMLNDVYVLGAPEARAAAAGESKAGEAEEAPQCVSLFRVRITGVRGAWPHVAAGFERAESAPAAPPPLGPTTHDEVEEE